jgi:hypothetical protein
MCEPRLASLADVSPANTTRVRQARPSCFDKLSMKGEGFRKLTTPGLMVSLSNHEASH